MKKRMFLAACLILTPYLASAASERAVTEPTATEKPMVRDGDASNTGINKRDRDDKTLTPMDQMNNPSDLKITQEIRQALMKGEYSMDAQNIKVITRNGTVTLRGPVKTAAELERINALVKAMPGINSIDNQLQVK
ncbi:MAG: BON domain-containing protein [Rhodocyclaceae bacterium]|nr:BON domain-containing protein [Rhodocyclaceae bacterium]MDZ4213990.1 BON domain-containing protein [Rhodocyclaceae bacterium]